MPTLVLGSPPPELEALMERRRRAGADRFDEVWEGVYHMVPGPGFEHARVESQVHLLLSVYATAAGLAMSGQFNLGSGDDDFRVPDGGLHRPGATGTWQPTAALVIEIVSPGDESRQKLSFFASHGVDEVLIVDPTDRTVSWFVLRGGEYHPAAQSGLLELGPDRLAELIDWP